MASDRAKSIVEKYVARSPDEQRFWDKHDTQVFDPLNVKANVIDPALKGVGTVKRKETKHGYDSAESEAAYENFVIQLSDIEAVLTEADLDPELLEQIYSGLAENAIALDESFYDNMAEQIIEGVYETSNDAEREMLNNLLSTNEGYEDILDALFEDEIGNDELDALEAEVEDEFEDERN